MGSNNRNELTLYFYPFYVILGALIVSQGRALENNNIDALQSELRLLKTQFNDRINNLEEKISALSTATEQEEVQQAEIESISMADYEDVSISKKEVKEVLAIATQEEVNLKHKPATPSFIQVMFNAFMSLLFDWFEPVVNIYKSYQRRGMLGIFILTILGIGLTLAGFGYLMQLLIDQLGSGAKSLLMLGAALGVIGLGITIKKKTIFYEFSTAIVALGILLLYSTVYFAGSVYSVIPYVAVVVLYLVIALSAHVLALWLDTKIIAALGIVGIAVMPMLSNIIVDHPRYYLISLAFVTVSSLVLAHRYVGLWLAHLSLAFVLMSLEWIIYLDQVSLSVIFIDLFYLLFFAYVCLTLLQRSAASHQRVLLFLGALIGGNLVFIFQATSLFSDSISLALVINSLSAIFAACVLFKRKHLQTHFIILVAAIWMLLTIVSLMGSAYWGIAWAVEGLFLLFLGRRYKLLNVVNQGQILTGISLLYCASAIAPYFPTPALTSFDGWMLSVCIVIILGAWLRLIDNNGAFNELTIKKIKPVLILIESVWLTLLTFSAAYLAIGDWAVSLIILGQFALLLRARKTKQISIDIFAAGLIVIPILYVAVMIVISNSYRFSVLPLSAKFAAVSVFAQLWLFAEFYRRSKTPLNIMVKIAEATRIGFYLLMPVFWISAAIRNLEEYALMLMWLPPVIALFFSLKIKHKWIVIQTQILVGLSSLVLLLAVSGLPTINGLITLALFVSFYGITFILDKRTKTLFLAIFSHNTGISLYKYIYAWGLFTVGFALPLWVLNIENSMLAGMITAALFWGILFNRAIEWLRFKLLIILVNTVSACIIITAWGLMFDNALYALIPVIYLVAALYQKEHYFNQSLLAKSLKENGDLGLHVVGAVSYILLLLTLNDYNLDLLIAPALAIHGALILFMKDRRLTTIKFSFAFIFIGLIKLALIDAANVLLWQKVMLFMGIGIFILGASFYYQKLTKIMTSDANEEN